MGWWGGRSLGGRGRWVEVGGGKWVVWGLCGGFESGVDMSDVPSYTSPFFFFTYCLGAYGRYCQLLLEFDSI